MCAGNIVKLDEEGDVKERTTQCVWPTERDDGIESSAHLNSISCL